MKNLTYSLYKLSQTVFTSREISMILDQTDGGLVKSKINYYVKRGEITAIRRGVYVKDSNFNKFELSTKIYTPSYISFDTILSEKGVIFQYSEEIYAASYLSREISVVDTKILYRKISNDILYDPRGIENNNYFASATLERAFMDTIYLDGNRHFDNLSLINFEKCIELLPIYGGKITEDQIKSYVDNN